MCVLLLRLLMWREAHFIGKLSRDTGPSLPHTSRRWVTCLLWCVLPEAFWRQNRPTSKLKRQLAIVSQLWYIRHNGCSSCELHPFLLSCLQDPSSMESSATNQHTGFTTTPLVPAAVAVSAEATPQMDTLSVGYGGPRPPPPPPAGEGLARAPQTPQRARNTSHPGTLVLAVCIIM